MRKYLIVMGALALVAGPVLSAFAAKKPVWKPAKDQVAAARNIRQPVTITNSIGMKFVLIPAGDFMMGSPPTEEQRDDVEIRHRVIISRPFYLQTTEVTQAQWHALMGTNPSNSKNFRLPVEQVSWHDAQKFIKRLNARECKEGINKYRLPTEAEWEYACRAGTTTAFSFGNTISADQANYDGRKYPYGGALSGICLSRTTPVGSYPPNQWGLYDMHGNLREWCSDWFSVFYYKNSPRRDPQGPAEGIKRVYRGGSFFDWALEVRSAYRSNCPPKKGNHLTGFRVVRDY